MAFLDGQIRINSEVSVTSSNANASLRGRLGSITNSVSTEPLRGRTRERPKVFRMRSTPSMLSDIVRHPDVSEGNLRERIREERYRQDTGDLIEFLRNKTPPPDNYMSIPDQYEHNADGKFSKIKLFRRRSKSSVSSLPRQIRLPDSAVAGTTTGGYRHIAISIPIQYSHVGPDTKSQYPVSQPTGYLSEMGASSAPVRTFSNERGVVTVLRTVAEDRESLSSSTGNNSSRTQLRPPVSVKPLNPPLSPPQSPESREGDSSKDYFSLLPDSKPQTGQLTPMEDEKRYFLGFSHDAQSAHTRGPFGGNAMLPKSNVSGRSPQVRYPSRRSSARAGMVMNYPQSLDGLILPSSHQRNYSGDSQRDPRTSMFSVRSIADSIATNDTEPVIAHAETAKGYTYVPVVGEAAESWGRGEEADDPTLPKITVISESPVVMGKRPAPPPTERKKSRQERVKERRQRDIIASRASRSRLREEARKVKSRESSRRRGSNDSNTVGLMLLHHVEEQSQLSPVMVVVDIQPSTPPAESQAIQGINSPTTAVKPSPPASAAAAKVAAPNTASSGPSPPQSPRTPRLESPYRPPPLDRTSLSRRREWNAERERNAREAKAQGKQPGDGKDLPSSANLSRRDLLLKYETLRDMRVREMERRLRRLERNGDVWLRALIPVLDNLNQTLVHIHEDEPLAASDPSNTKAKRKAPRAWQSEDEEAGPSERRGRSLGAARDVRNLQKRSTLHGSFLAELARRRDARRQWAAGEAGGNSTAGGGEESDGSVSGLDTIEPLMRELQGASRLSMEIQGPRHLRIGSLDDDEMFDNI
jgi:hypothetical protein